MSETAARKAQRYVDEGRVWVVVAEEDRVAAVVLGSRFYVVQQWRDERPECSCPASRTCSHIVAVNGHLLEGGEG